jgi:hypothetical protein
MGIPMREYAASSMIHATPEAVWGVLAGGSSRWTDWDSAVVRLDGTIALGAKVTLYSRRSCVSPTS